MLHYILQTIAFQLFFLVIYDLFLKKETFFHWNRFYLLFTAVISLILPFIQVQQIREVVPQQLVIRLPEVIIGNVQANDLNTMDAIRPDTIASSEFIWSWDYLLYAGMLIAGSLFAYKLNKMNLLIQKNPKRWKGNLIIVNLLNSKDAFSFFNYVFLGEQIVEEERQTILEHELVHVAQKHSFDLLLFEAMRIAFWFNPLVYMYQNRISTLHEYIADDSAMKSGGKKQYYEKLLSQVFDTHSMSFANTFFNQSLIKKRIVMLSKSKSNRIHLWKYALLVPMVFGMLVYTSCQKESEGELNSQSLDKYSYTLKMPGEMTDEQKLVHGQFEAFLKSNKDYVAWAVINYEKDEVTYSIHKNDKKIPAGFTDLLVSFENGESYTMYMNLKTEKPSSSNDIKFVPKDYTDASEVPFSIKDEVPTLEECEKLATNEEKRTCLSQSISRFVNRNFNINVATDMGLTGKQRISALFKIGKDGGIIDVKVRAPHKALEEETIRVINALPKIKPGMHNGKPVVVPYSLPILFQVGE